MTTHIHVHLGDASSDSVRELKAARQELTKLSSQLSSRGSDSRLDAEARAAFKKAETLVDQARQVLFDAE